MSAKLPLVRVALRGLLIQCGWNFERMQNIGFAFAVAPALKRLYPDKTQRIRALRRHMEFFNTHPYMAALIMGSALRVEADLLEEGAEAGPKVSALKQGLMGPLAAMGDSLFWATLKPLAALLAVAVAWMLPQASPARVLFLYLAFFNLPHLAFRLSSLWQGQRLGSEVAGFLKKIDTQGLIASSRLAALVLLGSALALFGRFRHPASGDLMPFHNGFLFFGAGLAMLMALRLRLSASKVLLACGLLCLLIAAVYSNHP